MGSGFSRLEANMHSLSSLALWEGFILLGGFFGIVFWKLFTRQISLAHLLEGDCREGSGYSSKFSPGRAQLVFFTTVFAVYYLAQVIHDPSRLPQIPDAVVAVLGGSQATYLGGKAYSLMFKDGQSRP
jgi:hypothetical protein